MVRRHPQIGENPIHLIYLMIAHEILQKTKVAFYKRETGVQDMVLVSIFILIKGKQPAFFTQSSQYLPRVPASAECNINIHPVGMNIQSVHTLLKQCRYVIHLSNP